MSIKAGTVRERIPIDLLLDHDLCGLIYPNWDSVGNDVFVATIKLIEIDFLNIRSP